MTILLFQPRFARLVEAGKKRQTIRGVRKRPIRVGDKVSLREWTGLPYRSKQRILGESQIKLLWPIEILEDGIIACRNIWFSRAAREGVARDDGFADFAEMIEWFRKTHGLPFTGILIKWEATSLKARVEPSGADHES